MFLFPTKETKTQEPEKGMPFFKLYKSPTRNEHCKKPSFIIFSSFFICNKATKKASPGFAGKATGKIHVVHI